MNTKEQIISNFDYQIRTKEIEVAHLTREIASLIKLRDETERIICAQENTTSTKADRSPTAIADRQHQ